MKSASAVCGLPARRTRAISAAPTGATCGSPLPATPTAIRRCWSSAAGRPGVRSLRGADGSKRSMRPRHVVLATGVSGIPNIPEMPTLGNFRGTVLHSGEYEDAERMKVKSALVIGTGNSGHDIAQDLYSAGAKVTL